MIEVEYVGVIVFLVFVLTHWWAEAKTKKHMMREHHSQLNLVRNFCGSILRKSGGEKWDKFEPWMKHTLNLTGEACHHNCDLNRNHHFQLSGYIKQQLHLIFLLSGEKVDSRIFDQLYFDDRTLRVKSNG